MQVSLYEIYLISSVDFERKFEYENYSENKLLFFTHSQNSQFVENNKTNQLLRMFLMSFKTILIVL